VKYTKPKLIGLASVANRGYCATGNDATDDNLCSTGNSLANYCHLGQSDASACTRGPESNNCANGIETSYTACNTGNDPECSSGSSGGSA